MNKKKYFSVFWMSLCGVLAIILLIFSNETSGILNAIAFIIQIFIGYTWYTTAVEDENEKRLSKTNTPEQKQPFIKRSTSNTLISKKSILKISVILIVFFVLFVGFYRLVYTPSPTRVVYSTTYTVAMYDTNIVKYVVVEKYKVTENLDITAWVFFGNTVYYESDRVLLDTKTLSWEEYQSIK